MKTTDIEYFKTKLTKEKELLQEEMNSVGRKSSTNSKEWTATVDDADVDSADENEVADKLEELEEHQGILAQLTKQAQDVDSALKKITLGKYGNCEICEIEIERKRLEANSSAKTCLAHMNS